MKCLASIVARSLPEPFTHIVATSRPTWSIAVPFADVLPPPKLATERSAPSRCEASRTWPRASSGTSDAAGQRSSTAAISRVPVVIDPSPRRSPPWLPAPR